MGRRSVEDTGSLSSALQPFPNYGHSEDVLHSVGETGLFQGPGAHPTHRAYAVDPKTETVFSRAARPESDQAAQPAPFGQD